MIERSLVLLKPDAVQRGIVGEILQRFERKGLKIVGMKMVNPDKEFVKNHYSTTDENLKVMGNKTKKDAEDAGIDLVKNVGSKDPLEIGKQIWKWNIEFLISSPLIAVVFEGSNAIKNIRKIVGNTLPSLAEPGTIRGDYSLDSAVAANKRNRAIYNLVHSSGNEEEALFEVDLWFDEDELLEYKRVHEDLYSY